MAVHKTKPKRLGTKARIAAAEFTAATAEGKRGPGRPRNVDHERDATLFVYLPQALADRLDAAAPAERVKRRPAKVDKSLIVEEALEAWLKKAGY